MADKVLLKKYANRRLYDTERSVYVTLAEVANIIRRGREVKIVDAKTDEDVTAFILSQIIVEEARNRSSLLPVSLLHLFIQFGQNVLAEFFDQYLELSIRNYLAVKETFDDQFRRWMERGVDFSEQASKGMVPLTDMSNPFVELFLGKSKETEKEDG